MGRSWRSKLSEAL
jgi:hypothetical protein